MPRKIPPPQESVEKINEQATVVRDAATKLSDRIALFTAFLNKLPGRVEAINYGTHPDDDSQGNLSFCLRLHREGKEWMISYGTFHEQYNNDPENPVEWKPLSDAPVRFKLLAIQQFPELLDAIANRQKVMAKEIETACAEFDDFAAGLGITAEKGGK